MSGLSVTQAQQIVLEHSQRLGAESVKLQDALRRVLSEKVYANRDIPPRDVSAMDGYALRSADLLQTPVTLEIIEDIKAGDIPRLRVGVRQCARIMTGAPVPDGTDAVIRVEDTSELPGNFVQINCNVIAGNDIRERGESMRLGDIVLDEGTTITPGVVGVLATLKKSDVTVYRRPRVAILSTGNELEDINDPVDPDRIPDANSHALAAQVRALGMNSVMLGIARDDQAELERYLRRGLEYDVLLVSGGTSVGVHDYVRPTVESMGVEMKFWRVDMKPGHPLAFGKTSSGVFFGLPGNPVSSMVCFEEFVAPALRSMMGHERVFRRTLQARLMHALKHRPGRTEFVRVVLTRDGDGYAATSTGAQGSGMLISMARADGLLVVPAMSNGVAAGEMVTVQLLDDTDFQVIGDFKE
jgi:molybdopterin molybdotransferase